MKARQQRIGHRVWQLLTDIRVGVMLMITLSLDLCLGFFCLNRQSALFEPMNSQGILPWLTTYGMANFKSTGWLFFLLLLLLLLAVNTLLCTTDRLFHLWRRWRQQGKGRVLCFIFSTHIMHIGMVAILCGYLLSYTLTRVFPSQTIVPGRELAIVGTPLRLKLVTMKLPVYEGTRLASFSGRIIAPEIQLHLAANGKERTAPLGFNDPVRFQGYMIFLQRFSPGSISSMTRARYIIIDVRQDPGAPLYFVGIVIFILGMLGYVIFRTGSRMPRSLS